MKTKLFAILIISIPLFFIGCDEDSITDAVLGSNSVTLSGDINKSFDAVSIAGMIFEDSTSGFVVLMQAEDAGTNSSNDILTLLKESDGLPAVGNYSVSLNPNLNGDFRAIYVVDDSTSYIMYSGSVNISESSASKVAGTFNLAGFYVSDFPDSTRELNITGEFSSFLLDTY